MTSVPNRPRPRHCSLLTAHWHAPRLWTRKYPQATTAATTQRHDNHDATDVLDELQRLLELHHGVLTTSQLREAGATPHQIRKWVAEGRLRRLSRGTYLGADSDSELTVVRALGGALTCVSALAVYGLWIPKAPIHPHVRVTRGVRQSLQRSPHRRGILSSAHLHIMSMTPPVTQPSEWPSIPHVDSLPLAILAAQKCCTRNELVAIGDSALRKGVSISDLRAIAESGYAVMKSAFNLLDPESDSGLESIMRMRLLPLQVKVRSQVWLHGWPVDLLIGDWLVIELDGYEFHSTPDAVRRDKRKDRILQAAGYTVLRYSAQCVLYEWDKFEPELLQLIRDGRHLRPTTRSKRRK